MPRMHWVALLLQYFGAHHCKIAFSRGNEWETCGQSSPSLTKDKMASILRCKKSDQQIWIWDWVGGDSPGSAKQVVGNSSYLASLILGCKCVWMATGHPSTWAPWRMQKALKTFHYIHPPPSRHTFIMMRLVGRVFAETWSAPAPRPPPAIGVDVQPTTQYLFNSLIWLWFLFPEYFK